MYTRCPKCGHAPLPPDQALPAACPACGVILAKVRSTPGRPPIGRTRPGRRNRTASTPGQPDDTPTAVWTGLLCWVPERVDTTRWWMRVALLTAFGLWGLWLLTRDVRTGAIGQSFIHGPLLVFHEAGHVLFSVFGEWMMFMGGTLGQLLMPALLAGALLIKNRDPYGAAIGLWLFGVSLLDVAPYVYDARQPQLMLLSGATGEAGGHDWIYLLSSVGLLHRSQGLGQFVHLLGAAVVLLALAWAAWVLRLQHARRAGDVFAEE
ncbi:MAG: hypothetical protein RL375_3450 [Pseudomonadota bacterium]